MIKYILLSSVLFLTSCGFLQKHLTPPEKKWTLEKKWTRSTFQKDYFGGRIIHRFQPILYSDLVIVANGVDAVVAFDQDSGNRVWSFPVEGGAEAGADLKDGVIYFGSGDGNFYALKAVNGQMLWNFPIRSEGVGRPTVADGKVFFIAGNNVAYSLNAETGRLIWPYKRTDSSSLSIRGASKPLIYNGKAIFGFEDGALVAIDIANGRVSWETQLNKNLRFKDIDSEPVIHDGVIYASSFDDSLYALKASDGSLVWSVEEGGYSGVTLYKDKLFYSTSNGKVVALDRKSGKRLWSFNKIEGYASRPKVFKGLVLSGDSSSYLYVLDSNTGKLIERFHPGRGVTSSVSLDKEGNLFFMSKDANLFKMQLKRFSRLDEWPWQKKSM